MSRRRIMLLLLTVWVVGTVPLLVMGWRATGETRREVERGRLELALLAASQADHILGEAFFEIELIALPLLAGATVRHDCLDGESLGPVGREVTNFSRAFFVLDCDGRVLSSRPADAGGQVDEELAGELFAAAARATDRYVSDSFISLTSGHATGVLGLPLYGGNGARVGTLVSLVDLEQHFSEELAEVVQQLGATGHADLIGEQGTVLASTRHALSATRGLHPEFYRDIMEARRTRIQRVRYDESMADGSESHWHIMAYSPLRGAPWGIAIGASEDETLQVVRRQRRMLARLAAAAAGAVAVGAGLVTFGTSRASAG